LGKTQEIFSLFLYQSAICQSDSFKFVMFRGKRNLNIFSHYTQQMCSDLNDLWQQSSAAIFISAAFELLLLYERKFRLNVASF